MGCEMLLWRKQNGGAGTHPTFVRMRHDETWNVLRNFCSDFWESVKLGTCYTCWFVDSLIDGSLVHPSSRSWKLLPPSSRPRPRGSTRRPFGGKNHDFSDSTWRLKKKNMKNKHTTLQMIEHILIWFWMKNEDVGRYIHNIISWYFIKTWDIVELMNEWCLMQWWLTSFDDSIWLKNHHSDCLAVSDLPGSLGWSGKMCQVDQRLEYAGMFFFVIWISCGFHMIFIHVVLCFLRFSKTLASWNVRATKALRNMPYFFVFRAVKRSVSSLPTCWQIDFNVDWKANFSRIYAPWGYASAGQWREESISPQSSRLLKFATFRLEGLTSVPLVLSNFPLICLSTVSGALMEEWDGEALSGLGSQGETTVRSLLGRDGSECGMWMSIFAFQEVLSTMSMQNLRPQWISPDSSEVFGRLVFLGQFPMQFPTQKNTQAIWKCLGFISMWGQATQNQVRSLEDKMLGHRVNWFNQWVNLLLMVRSKSGHHQLLWLLSYYLQRFLCLLGGRISTPSHLNHAQLQVAQGANEPASNSAEKKCFRLEASSRLAGLDFRCCEQCACM